MADKFTCSTGGIRADKFLAEQLPGRGRRALAVAFEDGAVRVNGKKAKKGQILGFGDVVELSATVAPPGGEPPLAEPDAPLSVVHADARLVVIAKPAGQPTHPLRPGERGTAANAVVARYPECAAAAEAPREGGAAHRLDAGTTGLLVFARDRAAWQALRTAFHDGRVRKTYLALVVGEIGHAGEIDLPLAHDRSGSEAAPAAGRAPEARSGRHGRVRVCDDPLDAMNRGALPAVTRFTIERRYLGFTLLRCTAETGRMHQVRAHLAHLSTPVVGDATYGITVSGVPAFAGHFLHAATVALPHPDGAEASYEAPLPADRAAVLAALTPR